MLLVASEACEEKLRLRGDMVLNRMKIRTKVANVTEVHEGKVGGIVKMPL